MDTTKKEIQNAIALLMVAQANILTESKGELKDYYLGKKLSAVVSELKVILSEVK